MARREADFFDAPLYLVLIVGNVSDASRAEQVLTEQGVDYSLRLDHFRTESVLSTVLGSEYKGLFFYVPSSVHHRAMRVLEDAGFSDTVPLTVKERSEG
ncbi:hypothetical protein [Petrachloros mirabilis]